MTISICPLEELDVPLQIAQRARDLHTGCTTDLCILHESGTDLANIRGDHPLWNCNEQCVTFASLEARNQCVGALTHSEWKATGTTDNHKQLLETAHKLWRKEIGQADQACGRFLALAHATSNIFTAATFHLTEEGVDVFKVLHVVEAALQYLDSITPDELIALCEAQYERTKRDMASGILFNKIELAISRDPSSCRALYTAVKARISVPISALYQTSMLSLAHAGELDEAISASLQDTQNPDSLIQRLAHWTVALLLAQYDLPKNRRDECVKILRVACRSTDDELRQTAIGAIGHAASRCKALRSDLLALADSEDQFALAVLANFLFMNFDDVKSDALFSKYVLALNRLSLETKGGIDNFDWVLSQLVGSDNFPELPIECMTNWLKRHGSAKAGDRDLIEVFDQTISKLVENSAPLEKLITSWLVAEERALGTAAGGLVSFLWVRNFRQLSFSKEILDPLSALELMYLARRTLGYVHSEEALLSLTFSLLNTQNANKRTFGLVLSLLTKEVGRNYINSTLEAIQQRKETCTDEIKVLLESAHSGLSNYINAINMLPRLQEFSPPLKLRRALVAKQSKQMRESMDSANKQSVFSQLATKISLKAGTGWFSVDAAGISETHKLQSFSQSVSLPRQATSDPVGYAINGMQYRLAKKDDA